MSDSIERAVRAKLSMLADQAGMLKVENSKLDAELAELNKKISAIRRKLGDNCEQLAKLELVTREMRDIFRISAEFDQAESCDYDGGE